MSTFGNKRCPWDLAALVLYPARMAAWEAFKSTRYSSVDLQQRFPHRVHVGGTLDLESYFRLLWMADIQVSTARHETFGISTVEAMYTETCCLLPDRASYPEITDNCRDALYGTSEELFSKLDHYLRDAEDRRRLARALRQRALRHTPPQVVPRVAAVIEEAVSVNRNRRHTGPAPARAG